MVPTVCKADWKWKFKSEHWCDRQALKSSPLVKIKKKKSSVYLISFEMPYHDVSTRWIGNEFLYLKLSF